VSASKGGPENEAIGVARRLRRRPGGDVVGRTAGYRGAGGSSMWTCWTRVSLRTHSASSAAARTGRTGHARRRARHTLAANLIHCRRTPQDSPRHRAFQTETLPHRRARESREQREVHSPRAGGEASDRGSGRARHAPSRRALARGLVGPGRRPGSTELRARLRHLRVHRLEQPRLGSGRAGIWLGLRA
jgi:hypothetical protein